MSSSRIGPTEPPSNEVKLWSVPEPPSRHEIEPAAEQRGPRAAHGLNPAVHKPLDAAFQPRPHRPVLVTATLNEATEQAVLRAGGPRLVAYRQFDPERRPVVLVHGINGSGSSLTALADKLTDAGRQVFVYQYQDFDSMKVSAAHLARELRHIWTTSRFREEQLELVAHSVGGIVGRLALNQLENEGSSRAGFPGARLHMFDTTLDGGWHEPSWLPGRGVIEPIVRLLGFGAFLDLSGSSAMFEGLYATELPGVSIANIVARDPTGREGNTRNLHSLQPADQAAIAAYLDRGELPEQLRIRNFARGLAQDVQAAKLRERLRLELVSREPAEAMRIAYDAVVPQVWRQHDALIADGTSPAVERLVELLRDARHAEPVEAGPGVDD